MNRKDFIKLVSCGTVAALAPLSYSCSPGKGGNNAQPKLTFGSWAFTFGPFSDNPWSLSRVMEYVADVGYDGISLNGFRPHVHFDDYNTRVKCQELMNEMKSLGIEAAAYAPNFGDVPPAEVDQEAYLEAIRKSLFVCEQLDIHILRVDTVSPPVEMAPDKYEQMFSRLVKTWASAAEEAKKSEVMITWEFEPGFWLNKPSEVKRVADTVESDNFTILFDTCHAYMSGVVGARHTGEREILPGGMVEYAKMLSGSIGHVHLIDSDGTLHDDETSTHTAFGEGKINFIEVMEAIKPVISQLEWWGIDFCFNEDAEEKGRDALPFVKDLANEVL